MTLPHIRNIRKSLLSLLLSLLVVGWGSQGFTNENRLNHENAPQQTLKQDEVLHLLTKLPPRQGDFPSQEFFDLVNLETLRYQNSGQDTVIYLIPAEEIDVLYAKIILHAYGVRSNQTRTSETVGALGFHEVDRLLVFGGLEPHEEVYLTERDISFSEAETAQAVEKFDTDAVVNSTIDTAVIVLGNEPFDESTPTLDMVKRVMAGIDAFKVNPNAVLVLTGGKTSGRISEAKMMALIALSKGIPLSRIVLEEEAKSTSGNVTFTAKILDRFQLKNSIIVSKAAHLLWALPYFQRFEVFGRIQGQPVYIAKEEIVQQMEDYLSFNNNERVRQRLDQLLQEIQGVD